jgi:perosamine synthetase
MTRQGTHAPILLDCFAGKYNLKPEEFPRATIADSLSVALPLYPGLSSNDLQTVVDELNQFGGAAGHTSTKQRAA